MLNKKFTLILLLVLTLVSCEKFDTKTQIDPLFEAKSKNEQVGNGKEIKVTIKIPLSEDIIGAYSVSDLIEDAPENPDAAVIHSDKKWFKKFIDNMKYGLINMGIRGGVKDSNRIRYSTDYPFPEIDSKYIKSAVVKKMFFALEECDEQDFYCQQREEKTPATFKFIDKFFVNLSIIKPGDPIDFDKINEDVFVDKEPWDILVDKAFNDRIFSFSDYRDEKGTIPDSLFYNVNIARHNNTKKNDARNAGVIRNEGKVFIFKIKHNPVGIKRFFRSELFNKVVQDVTLMGDNLFVELKNPSFKKKFFQIIQDEVGDINSIGISHFEGCSELNCISLKVNSLNLVPMFERSSHIRFDTFISLKHFERNDFKYNGFLELDVTLYSPI